MVCIRVIIDCKTGINMICMFVMYFCTLAGNPLPPELYQIDHCPNIMHADNPGPAMTPTGARETLIRAQSVSDRSRRHDIEAT